jgi:hypothetical protein
MTSTAIRIDEMKNAEKFPRHAIKLRARRDAQNLAAFVVTARRTDAMWHIRRSALRASLQLRQFQHAVIGTAHTLPAPGWFTLGNTHKINSKLQF